MVTCFIIYFYTRLKHEKVSLDVGFECLIRGLFILEISQALWLIFGVIFLSVRESTISTFVTAATIS